MTKADFGLDECNCLALRRAARRVSNFYDAELAGTGLRTSQLAILSIVASHEQMTINSLADYMELDRTTAGRNLRPLEKAKFVKVVPSPLDRRTRTITITAGGLKLLKEMLVVWRQAQAKFEKWNGRDQTGSLRGALNGLRVGG